MKQIILFLSFSIIATISLEAQNHKPIDSLRNVIQQVEGKSKIEPMTAIVRLVLRKDPNEAVQFIREIEKIIKQYQLKEERLALLDLKVAAYQRLAQFDSLEITARKGVLLSKAMKNDSTLGLFYKGLGIFHEKVGSLDSALYYYKEALEKRGANKLALYNNLGLAYNRSGASFEAIKYLELAVTEAQKQGNINAEAVISNNIGSSHRIMGDKEKAVFYYKKSLELKGQIGDERGKLFALLNLVRIDYERIDKEQYLETALALAEKINDPYFLPLLRADKGMGLLEQERYQEALEIGLSIYQQAKEGNGLGLLDGLHLITRTYVLLEDFEKVKIYGQEMEALAKEQNSFDLLQLARGHLLEAYEALEEYKKFNEIARVYFPAKDSLTKKTSLDRLAYLDNKLKNVEQEKEIDLLNTTLQQRQIRRNWIIAIALLIALTLSLIIYLRNKQVIAQKKVARELEVVNQELKNLDEMKTRFFTNISHELRTPVTLILTPVEEIIRKYAQQLSAELKDSLGLVRNNSKKLLALVEELLELSRIDAGKSQLDTTPTDLASFSKQLFSAYESGAQINQIDYSFHNELEEEPPLMIDKKRLEKIINNLLGNALKFTPNGGKVSMLVKREEKENILIQVTDTGRGISPEDLPHIFDRYFQTKRKDIPTEGGSGIGLALAKELAELMQGSLIIESDSDSYQKGKGSTFTLRFPAKEVEQQPLAVEPVAHLDKIEPSDTIIAPLATQSFSTQQKQGKVLIVEDNLDMQKLLVSLLSDSYECILANNGQEAWDLLEKQDASIQHIDLIISDVMMPQMDGYSLLDHIKSHQHWQQFPVIMLTARAAEEDKLQALRMGVDDYLTKPFSPEELLARVANLIQNYRQRQAFNAADPKVIDIDFAVTDSANQIWLKDLEVATLNAIDKRLELKANYLAEQMAISSRQLLRRLKSITGLSTTEYIQEVKLQKARHLLENKTYQTISEVAYASGFSSSSYFTKVFKKQFGKRPME